MGDECWGDSYHSTDEGFYDIQIKYRGYSGSDLYYYIWYLLVSQNEDFNTKIWDYVTRTKLSPS